MRATLPESIAARYRPATDAEIRAESFGLLREARHDADTDWRMQRGTFDDQAIFGPKRDFACACGKYAGRPFQRIICDQCGVKVQSSEARRIRCAHINLAAAIEHPLGRAGEQLCVVPVLPVAYVESLRGAELIGAYAEVLQDGESASRGFLSLLDLLAPLLITAHEWALSERLLIAHGMALKEA